MKNLAERLLSKTDRQQIETVVAAVEKKTAGEIVCMVVSSSYDYPMASLLGATAIALPLALLAAHLIGGWLWVGTQNMYLFLGFFALLFIPLYWIMARWMALKRLFVSQREIDEEVEEAAVTGFFRQGLYRTRDANGVLLFISVFERKVWLLADQGIHQKVGQDEWDRLVDRITGGIRKGQAADVICDAVRHIAALLQSHFPAKSDDTDELENLILGDA